MAITSGGDARTQLPQKILNHSESPLPSFFPRGSYFYHFLEVGGNGRTKKKRREGEKRMILTRNNSFDFDGDLKTIENEV